MAFITKKEFETHVFPEIINAISRNDQSKLKMAIEAAITQVSGYLSRYKINEILATPPPVYTDVTDDDEEEIDEELSIILDPYASLRTWVKDVTKWHFINLVNPNIDLALSRSRYEDAISELQKIQAGRVAPNGWPLAEQPQGATGQFHIVSSTKRQNHF
ncbi:hypothetical protein [Pedobacter sp. SL55]|uniref:hypothetical protein n=1 Tax=Pedobacter sp. SL55 TaxID=2995161 RepID=UPI00226D9EDD|nr:hypothetical protein [Pedobacter sp. SL55]WAC40572.1 hypothetical protein OVA16_18705 [Pedobacter sp. SL55]